MATQIHITSSISTFPYLKEHGTETCMWWKSWFHWSQRECFLDFRNARISPRDKGSCAMSPQICTGSADYPPDFKTKPNNPTLSGGFLISRSINSVVGNRVSCAWNVNKEKSAGVQRWLTAGSSYSCHFWAALPCAAPHRHFKWFGRYFIWRSKALCTWLTKISLLFFPLFKLHFRSRLY